MKQAISLPDHQRHEQAAGLYIHIPFCKTKCPYCSFSSSPISGSPSTAYLNALKKQARTMAHHPLVKPMEFSSLFLGGGTPTIYSGEDVAGLIKTCRALFSFTDYPEITVEANPNTVTQKDLSSLHKAGVNRLSFGVQSFSDELLKKIGRSHSSNDARKGLKLAQKIGFEMVNIDLIYGLPGQTTADWQNSLDEALAFDPGHLSLYELMIEAETPFSKAYKQGELNLPSEDEVIQMAEAIQSKTQSADYQRYEIANYAKPGQECQHNINYWRNGQYLGLGAAAFSYLMGIRIKTAAAPKLFAELVNQQKMPFDNFECLPLAASFRESMIMGLRMVRGVSLSDLQARYSISAREYYGSIINDLEKAGMLIQNKDQLRLTAKSFPVANQVLSRLV